MKNRIDENLVKYFDNVVKNIPRFNWTEYESNGESDSIVCSTTTQLGTYSIKRYNYATTMYLLYLDDDVISGYMDNVDTAKSLASYRYRKMIQLILKF